MGCEGASLNLLIANFRVKENGSVGNPLFGIKSLFDMFVKAGVKPIFGGCDQAMFSRVVINIFDRLGKICFILNMIFPNIARPNDLPSCGLLRYREVEPPY